MRPIIYCSCSDDRLRQLADVEGDELAQAELVKRGLRYSADQYKDAQTQRKRMVYLKMGIEI